MSSPKPDQLPAVVLESVEQGGQLLDQLLTQIHGEDWWTKRLVETGHGTHVEDITTRLIASQDAWIRRIVGR